jgi:peptidoglycan hydrolase CwlO-like protein
MNRSILIVICDFLLVSLLAFSTVDITKLQKPGGSPALTLNQPTNHVTGRQDLGAVMSLALQEERKNRDALLGELSRTKQIVGKREEDIQAAQNQMRTLQSQLRAKEELAGHLESEQTNLQGQVALAQANIEHLNEQLHATTVESVISKEQRAALEAAAHKEADKERDLQQKLADLQHNNESLMAERGALASQLQMSEASNRMAFGQVSQLQDEVTSQRQQNAKLTEGVTVLASKSSELAKEIRENRALAPNEIFDMIVTNRLLASFYGLKSGAFGDTSKYKQAQTVLVNDGTNTFAILHVQDTPLTLWTPGTQWSELSGTLARGPGVMQIQSLAFDSVDPRVVMIPVSDEAARQSGSTVFKLSADPYKFQNAVVVGTREDYYGESNFQIDLTEPQYLKMDHSSFRALFGKFNPSSGDLVFSKTGALLGVMVNNNYCVLIRGFSSSATLRFGPDGRNQPTANTLSKLYAVVAELPFKLQ